MAPSKIRIPTATRGFFKLPLHQEPAQKPGRPGKGWPGQAFWVFGQAYRENVAWLSLASMATAKLSWQPWPPKLGLPGLVTCTSTTELSRQPWSEKPGLTQALKIQARLGRAFLNFQAKNSFGHLLSHEGHSLLYNCYFFTKNDIASFHI